MKKFLIVGFVLASLCAIAQTEKANGVEFKFEIQDGRATLTGTSAGSSIAGDLVLPQTLGGCPVTSIGDCAFSFCRGLAFVTIPLTSVTIPSGVTSIGKWAFSGCSELTLVTLPSSVTSIGDCAFVGCYGLKTFVVDKDNPKFAAINGLLCTKDGSTVIVGVGGDVTLPSSVTSIGDGAFSGCSGLTSVTIPPSVTSIEEGAFFGCSGLMAFVVDKDNPKFTAINGMLCAKDGSTVIAGVNGDVTIPSSVRSIGKYAFGGCRGLTSVTIPPSVTNIGLRAFENCRGLTSVTIPPSVTSIGDGAFRGCSGLTSVTIPPRVTSIGEEAFAFCSGLTSVMIPPSVTNLGELAFDDCWSLKTVRTGKGDSDRVKKLLENGGLDDVPKLNFIESPAPRSN